MKKIAILMSTYNGEEYLSKQIDSIFNQDIMFDLTLYIRDDGSSDQTLSIIEEYSKHYNIKYIQGKNIGVIASYFELLKIAKDYDFYAFSDQDDIWLPDKMSCAIKSLETLDQDKPALYGGCSTLIDNDFNNFGVTQINRRGITFYNTMIQNLMPGHSQVFNQKLYQCLTEFDLDYTKIAVHDYWLSLYCVTFGNIIFDNTPHTLYRQHESNEIGYNKGNFSWITERYKRVKNQKAKEITVQNKYFYNLYCNKLNIEFRNELELFLSSQNKLGSRIRYLIKSRVYRQRKFETILFYILYLLGGYRIE